jgi:hypothetical protein
MGHSLGFSPVENADFFKQQAQLAFCVVVVVPSEKKK